MDEKIKCSKCKHRLPKKICGCPESPYYKQEMELTNACDSFAENPAEEYHTKGLLLSFKGGFEAEAIQELETAISLGLPQDEEAHARLCLGENYFHLGDKLSRGDTASPEFTKSREQMEKSVLMDSQGRYGLFSDPVNRVRIGKLAALYVEVSQIIRQQKGIDSAIAYLEEKLRLFDYLSTPPLFLLFTLAERYMEKDNKELARQALTKILEAPCNTADEIEADITRSAEQRLRVIETGGTKRSSGCFIATAVYGNSNTTELAILREFRDNILLSKPMGRLFVHFYYLLSPSIAKIIEKSQLRRKLVEKILLKPILAIIRHSSNR